MIPRLRSRSTEVLLHTFLSRGDGRFEATRPQRVEDDWNPRNRWFLADSDGDGRADVMRVVLRPTCQEDDALRTGCRVGNAFPHAGLQVHLSDGDGSWRVAEEQNTDWTFHEGDDAHWFAGDADGDGRADVQRVVNLAPHGSYKDHHPGIQTAFSRGRGRFAVGGVPQGCPPNPRPLWCSSALTEIDEPWRSWGERLPWLDQDVGSDLVQSGDFDGDGRSDLALASVDPATRQWVRLVTAFSAGDGGYRTVPQVTTLPVRHLNYWWEYAEQQDHYPNRWMTGDVNGDGATDLLVASPRDFGLDPAAWPQKVAVSHLVSGRRGMYALEQPPATSYVFTCRAPQDTDGDDTARRVRCQDELSFRSFTGDVDGDGQDDFMYAGRSASPGDQRMYYKVRVTPAVHEAGRRWSTGDVDGDGRQDLVLPQYTNAGITVHTLLRRRDGTWDRRSEPAMPFLYNAVARNWLVADVGSADGGPDGRADLLYVHYQDDANGRGLQVYTLLSKGDGTWALRYRDAKWPGYSSRDTANWRPADIDADGDTDLIHVDSSGLIDLTESDRGVRVDVLRSDGDGAWTPVPAREDTWRGFGSADNLGWRPMDVNGDGRSDLVHLDGRGPRLRIRSLLATADGSWRRQCDPDVTDPDVSDKRGCTVDAPPDRTDTRSWRAVEVNHDGKADLVHLSDTGGALRSLVLLGDGNGKYTARAQQLGPGLTGADTRRWQVLDVNGDGASDLVHLADLRPGLRVSTLVAQPDGSFARHRPDDDSWSGLDLPDTPAWQAADTGGDGRNDLIRVDYEHPVLRVRALHAASPAGLLTAMDNGAGHRTEIAYRPSSDFGPRTRPASGVGTCQLPHGVVVPLTAQIVQHTQGVQADRQDIGYTCARWSYAQRRLLGWAQTTTVRQAAPNRPAQTSVRRDLLDEHCLGRNTELRTEDEHGAVLTRTATEYPAADSGSASVCLPERVRVWQHNAGQDGLETRTELDHDEFGNMRQVRSLGDPDDPRDDRVVRREVRPAYGPWLLRLPAMEETLDSTLATARRIRLAAWCYDGDNGTGDGPCPGVPVKGLVTATKQAYKSTTGQAHERAAYRTTTFAYDAHGNPTRVTDPRGNTTTTAYDPVRHLFPERVCNALHQCTTTEWDLAQGLPKATTDANGARSERASDALGRVLTNSRPGRGLVTYRYLDWDDPERRRVRETVEDGTPDGLWSETSLDGLDRPWLITREGDRPGRTFVRHFWYSDTSTRPAARSNWTARPVGRPPALERYTYDAAGRLVEQTHADGAQLRWTYGNDTDHAWIEARDERGQTNRQLFDAHGRLVEVREHDGARESTTRYGFDAADRIRTVTDPAGNVTRHAYDLLGRLRSTDDPDLGLRTWTWDAAGNVATQTDARGRRLSFTYDALNRPRTKRHEDGSRVVWHYDEPGHGAGTGRLTSTADPSGKGCAGGRSGSLSYDKAGRVVREARCTGGESSTMRFAFDGLDRHRAVVYPDGERQTYGYDSAGRLRDMPGLVGEYQYDADGHRTRAERADSTVTEWEWDERRHWLNKVSTQSPVTGRLLDLEYVREPDGLIKTSSTKPGSPPRHYTYDGLDRLTDVSGGLTQHFAWAPDGNLVSDSAVGTYTYPPPGPSGCARDGSPAPCRRPHAALQAGDERYTYDPGGNTTAIRRTLPAVPRAPYTVRRGDSLWSVSAKKLGDPTRWPRIFTLNKGRPYPKPPGGRFTHPGVLHPGQRLLLPAAAPKTVTRRLRWDDDNRLVRIQDAAGRWTDLRYDAAGQRVEKRHDARVTRYFGPWLERTHPARAGTAERTRTTKYYWAGDTLIARRSGKDLHFYHQDHLGSTAMLSTGEGKVAARYEYLPFGGVSRHTGPASTTLRHTGQRADDESGLTLMGARYYDPRHARFLSPDTVLPSLTSTQAANRYAYAYGNPLTWTDPTGHRPECACGTEEATEEPPPPDESANPAGTESLPKELSAEEYLTAAGIQPGTYLMSDEIVVRPPAWWREQQEPGGKGFDLALGVLIGPPRQTTQLDLAVLGVGALELAPLALWAAAELLPALPGAVVSGAGQAGGGFFSARLVLAGVGEETVVGALAVAVEQARAVGGVLVAAAVAIDLLAYVLGGGHHPVSQAAVRDDPNYDPDQALAVPKDLLERMGGGGKQAGEEVHRNITRAQAILYREFAKTGKDLTWADVARIETQAMTVQNIPQSVARAWVDQAIQQLRQAGVKAPTRIPYTR